MKNNLNSKSVHQCMIPVLGCGYFSVMIKNAEVLNSFAEIKIKEKILSSIWLKTILFQFYLTNKTNRNTTVYKEYQNFE